MVTMRDVVDGVVDIGDIARVNVYLDMLNDVEENENNKITEKYERR